MSKKINKGSIILVPFPFTNLKDSKIRPALVLAKTSEDYTVSFISSKKGKMKKGDVGIEKDESNNLKQDSKVVCSKIATLNSKIVLGKIGELSKKDIGMVDKELKSIFGI